MKFYFLINKLQKRMISLGGIERLYVYSKIDQSPLRNVKCTRCVSESWLLHAASTATNKQTKLTTCDAFPSLSRSLTHLCIVYKAHSLCSAFNTVSFCSILFYFTLLLVLSSLSLSLETSILIITVQSSIDHHRHHFVHDHHD